MTTTRGTHRLTIFPADTPTNVVHSNRTPSVLDPKESDAIWDQIYRNQPQIPAIQSAEYLGEVDGNDQLTEHIPRNGTVLKVVNQLHRGWRCVDEGVRSMRHEAQKHQADILIRRQPTGHYAILALCNIPLHFDILRANLRMDEERARRLRQECKAFDKLTWRYFPRDNLIINGDFLGPQSKYPPTVLFPSIIREHIRLVVNPNMFHRGREMDCRQGHCTSDSRDKRRQCPYHEYGLPQCTAVKTAHATFADILDDEDAA